MSSLARADVPARVVISEYLDIGHAFYGGKEPGLVNGVLDRLARSLRPHELGGGASWRRRISVSSQRIARFFAPLAGAGCAGPHRRCGADRRPARRAIRAEDRRHRRGRAFPSRRSPDAVAQKLLRVNLSDLAAKGAKPLGYLLTTALPRRARRGVARGFRRRPRRRPGDLWDRPPGRRFGRRRRARSLSRSRRSAASLPAAPCCAAARGRATIVYVSRHARRRGAGPARG